MSKDFVMYRIDKELYKKLQYLKVELELPTINAVIEKLIEDSK